MKITVITVSYNAASTVASTIESVASQSYKNIEHIVIDGASTDGTLDILRKYEFRLAMLVSEPDKGIYDAMNKGLAFATGDVIGFLNADDFYASANILAKVAEVFSVERVDCCFGDLSYVSQKNEHKIVRYWRSSEFKLRAFESGWAPPHPTFFVRRECYVAYGGYRTDLRVAADVELMARMLEIKRLKSAYIPEILVNMRLGGVSNASLQGVLNQNLEVRNALRALGLRFSYVRFIFGKLYSRLLQFIMRPS